MAGPLRSYLPPPPYDFLNGNKIKKTLRKSYFSRNGWPITPLNGPVIKKLLFFLGFPKASHQLKRLGNSP